MDGPRCMPPPHSAPEGPGRMCRPIHASVPLWSSSCGRDMGTVPGLASLPCSIILPCSLWVPSHPVIYVGMAITPALMSFWVPRSSGSLALGVTLAGWSCLAAPQLKAGAGEDWRGFHSLSSSDPLLSCSLIPCRWPDLSLYCPVGPWDSMWPKVTSPVRLFLLL